MAKRNGINALDPIETGCSVGLKKLCRLPLNYVPTPAAKSNFVSILGVVIAHNFVIWQVEKLARRAISKQKLTVNSGFLQLQQR